MRNKTEIPLKQMIKIIGITSSKYYRWLHMVGQEANGNKVIPKKKCLLPEEKEAIINFARENYANNDLFVKTGYRRIAYIILDKDIVHVSPSSVNRVLKEANLLNKWNTKKSNQKGNGFKQPDSLHQHWHTDIKYIKVQGKTLFLITVIDGYSRYITHHEVRQNMSELDVQITIQKAKDKYPDAKPRIITDNGSQFISKEFGQFIDQIGATHIRTSVGYPQSNGKIERFNRTISGECLRIRPVFSVEKQKEVINGYIEYYNNERLHSAIHYLTPSDVMNNLDTEILANREKKLILAQEKRKRYWRENGAA